MGIYIIPNERREKMNLMIRCHLTGLSIHNYPDGTTYVGECKNSIPNGQGVYTWFDGEQYVGEFKNGN